MKKVVRLLVVTLSGLQSQLEAITLNTQHH